MLTEFHWTPYSGNPGYQKMISIVKRHFFWPMLKVDIALFIAKCEECQLIKPEHQHRLGFLQPLPIPKCKWEVISMYFITDLPKSKKQNDSIFVVVEKLSKPTHFIRVKLTYKAVNNVDIFLKQIFRLHGIPKEIILDLDTKFTKKFWRSLFFKLETQLNFTTSYHPQTGRQTKKGKPDC